MAYTVNVSDAMLDLTGVVRKLGIEKVADAAGIRANIVKKFCMNPLQCKNSDIDKIKKAVASMRTDDEQ